MKKRMIYIFMSLIFLVIGLMNKSTNIVFAEDFSNKNIIKEEIIFQVFDEFENLINETQNVQVGDIFIDKNFNVFEIYLTDEVNKIAKALYIETLEKPNITQKIFTNINGQKSAKLIGQYCTHNDESYINGDGFDSVYGEGGIHDIAKLLAKELNKIGVNVVFDESLHIPHDSNAYTRSRTTAKDLLQDYKLSAIFDIHRDGASRKTYVKTVNGKERCGIRIVVGQANKNKNQNLEFAKYLMSVSEIICPWLFVDIYYAKGHYNQDLNSKSLLFEMGSHLVEKSLVEETIPYLAKVIDKTLFETSINEDGDLTIGETTTNTSTNLDEYFETKNEESNRNNSMLICLIAFFVVAIFIGVFVYIFRIKNIMID